MSYKEYDSCVLAATAFVKSHSDDSNVAREKENVKCHNEAAMRACCVRGESEPVYACMSRSDAPQVQTCALPGMRGRDCGRTIQ